MPVLTLKNTEKIWYEEKGEGKTAILFLHGWSMSSKVWHNQMDFFSSSYRVIALDFPGHGGSDAAEIVTLDSLAIIVEDFCSKLSLHDVRICGWSLGGLIALRSAYLLGSRLKAIVLTGTTPKFTINHEWLYGQSVNDVEKISLAYKRNAEKTRKRFFDSMFSQQEKNDTACMTRCSELYSCIDAPDPLVSLKELDILLTTDFRTELPYIEQPILSLSGEFDTICNTKASRVLSEMLVQGSYVEFSGCGHAPFITRIESWNHVVDNFLRGVCERNY